MAIAEYSSEQVKVWALKYGDRSSMDWMKSP